MEGRLKELAGEVQMAKENGLSINKTDFLKMREDVALLHVPRADQFSVSISDCISDLGSSRKE